MIDRSPFIVVFANGVPAAFPVNTSYPDIILAAQGHSAMDNETVQVWRDEHGHASERALLATVEPDGTVKEA